MCLGIYNHYIINCLTRIKANYNVAVFYNVIFRKFWSCLGVPKYEHLLDENIASSFILSRI